MSNDLQADITTHLKGNGLTAATQGVDKLQGAIKRVHGSSHDLQSKAGEVFGRFGTVIEGVEHRLHRVSRAIGRLGGESVAGPLHKLLAVGGLASGFGVLGLAVAGAGVGINMLTEHMEKNAEIAKEDAKAVEELAKAHEEAKHAASEHAATTAKGENKTLRTIAARGGTSEDVEEAKRIAKNGANGLSLAESLKLVAKSLQLPKEIRAPAMDAAIKAGKTGLIDPNEALEKIVQSKKLRKRLEPGPNGEQYTEDVAAHILVDAEKKPTNRKNIEAARAEMNRVDQADEKLGFSIHEGDKATGADHQGEIKSFEDINEGKVSEALIEAMRKALGPPFQALLEEAKKNNEYNKQHAEDMKALIHLADDPPDPYNNPSQGL